MPVRKFRSVEEMEQGKWIPPGSEEFSRAVRAVFWIAATFSPLRKVPPGVHKFRSIEEAQARKKTWALGRDE
jgi:hypothetical protein